METEYILLETIQLYGCTQYALTSTFSIYTHTCVMYNPQQITSKKLGNIVQNTPLLYLFNISKSSLPFFFILVLKFRHPI